MSLLETVTSEGKQDGFYCAAQDILGDLGPLERVRSHLNVCLTEQTYLPKQHRPLADWVVRVATPAYQAVARSGQEVKAFCTVGTGSGLDALAAIEILDPRLVLATDLQADVVDCALRNIRRNLAVTGPAIRGESGDLAEPVRRSRVRFDLIYENLPNIPLPAHLAIDDDQASSSYFEHRGGLPAEVEHDLLSLHYLMLRQSRSCLSEGGTILSSIGARRPLRSILRMAELAEVTAEPTIYTWKIQSEAEEVIEGYAQQEARTGERFSFFRPQDVEEAFADLSPGEAARNAEEIEHRLERQAMSATRALDMLPNDVAHTVVVLKSAPR